MQDHLIIDILRIINVLIALSAVLPSWSIFKRLVKERKKNRHNTFNKILRDTFFLFIVILIFNALITFLLLVDFDFDRFFGVEYSQAVFNIRNIGVNLTLFFLSWSTYFTIKGGDKK